MAPPLGPDRALAQLRPVLFHAAAYEAWPSIAEHGLRTAAQLADEAGQPLPAGLRDRPIDLHLVHGSVRLRDQRTLARGGVEAHLDGVSLDDWLSVLNERVFLFARQSDLTTLVNRHRAEGQDVVLFDTLQLLRSCGEQVEVAVINTGAPQPYATCACLGSETFVPLAIYDGTPAGVQEVTVVGGITSVEPLVRRVVRHLPDGSTDVLVGDA